MELQLLTGEGKPYLPRPTQAKFHASPAVARCMSGGFGSGKSTCGAMEAVVQCLEIKDAIGAKGLIARYGWDELTSTTWKTFLDCIPGPIRAACVIRQRPYPVCIFPNGFEVRGMNLKSPWKLGSEQFSFSWIDEAAEPGVEEEFFLMLAGRRRNHKGRRCIFLTCNPPGRTWIWKRFFAHREGPSYKKYRWHEGFIATTQENVANLPPDYIAFMRETYGDDWWDRYVQGDFGLAEGQILVEFNPDLHMLRPIALENVWPRFRGLDHGLTHPTAALWIACDFEGNVIAYREHFRRGITPENNVREILAASALEEEITQFTVIDPSTRAAQTAGGVIQSLIDQYREAGLYCREGNNDVKASIALLKSLLLPDPNRLFPRWHPRSGEPGAPRLFITTDCPRLKWEMENWRWKHIKPGQIDRQKVHAIDDDCVACLRYLVLEKPFAASPIPLPAIEDRFLSIIAEIEAEKHPDFSPFVIGGERVTR